MTAYESCEYSTRAWTHHGICRSESGRPYHRNATFGDQKKFREPIVGGFWQEAGTQPQTAVEAVIEERPAVRRLVEKPDLWLAGELY